MEMGQNAGAAQSTRKQTFWVIFDFLMIFSLHIFYQATQQLHVLLSNPFKEGLKPVNFNIFLPFFFILFFDCSFLYEGKSQFPREQFREQLSNTTKYLVRGAAMIPSE